MKSFAAHDGVSRLLAYPNTLKTLLGHFRRVSGCCLDPNKQTSTQRARPAGRPLRGVSPEKANKRLCQKRAGDRGQ